jgi:hypothetical protein
VFHLKNHGNCEPSPTPLHLQKASNSTLTFRLASGEIINLLPVCKKATWGKKIATRDKCLAILEKIPLQKTSILSMLTILKYGGMK